ncbi:hypothetical protein DB30_06100 [Enhygromyxa salina]|uniref:DUF1993 domain-containing protein n=1 Tax=Enhygromyxa salina TaxID=215803 RepID=A0A0C1ZVI0_9BACT|nr:DUF1993 domain-containing protein [Enhygromyxa salina]KIG15068.1 hypothetical protein DB30_06100 [Enhygromyxa salina]
MYTQIFGQMKKQLAQMDSWLMTAATYADAKKFDVDVFMTQRLAPDQFALARQVQIACDAAKLGAARITGKEAPSHADSEQTIAELRERIAATLTYLEGLTAADFGDVGERTVTQSRWEGKVMSTHDYLLEHVMPNFYFHSVHVYAILRHNGVGLGKRDYLGTLSKRDA